MLLKALVAYVKLSTIPVDNSVDTTGVSTPSAGRGEQFFELARICATQEIDNENI
jgi:hypothetical protein